MDVFTHGLLGLTVGRVKGPEQGPTPRAVAWAAVLASLAPDLDVFYGRNEALAAFKYHRAYTHSFLLAPLMAAAVTGVVKLAFPKARPLPVYGFSLLSLLLAHIVPDIWTGWGTMALLPFSSVRLGLDWVSIVDPLLTGLVVAALLWGRLRPGVRRQAALAGLVAVYAYVGMRGVQAQVLRARVAAAYPAASRIQVWPTFNSFGAWQYAAELSGTYATGRVGPWSGVAQDQELPAADNPRVLEALRRSPDLTPLLRFARFPLVISQTLPDGSLAVSIQDLRYNYARYRAVLGAGLELRGLEVERVRLHFGHR
ncbi:metal-dependent hydrolase [Caldinitratiruptor microaerophilus]|uniref:Hydrolase n=1 Tax=Caldinitratiruptor microaerophilus TaxID=671077 RepID=A0AA35CLB8_9FIRM|nr:metal-dependent hydrolase [Caldinitratiruptor microaerophilus]BDG61322.1 hydrolase [Caldinitratiruptor microaerophilus]